MSINPQVKTWIANLNTRLYGLEDLIDTPSYDVERIEDQITTCKAYLENLDGVLSQEEKQEYYNDISALKAKVAILDKKLHKRKNPLLLRIWRGFLSIFGIKIDLPALPSRD